MSIAYAVLAGKIAERGIKKTTIADSTGMSLKSLRSKIMGRSDFTLPECITIRDRFFPELTLDDLFTRSDDANT